MKTCILFFGHFRTFEKTAESWRKVQQNLDADVYCSTWNVVTNRDPRPLSDKQKDLLFSFDKDASIRTQGILNCKVPYDGTEYVWDCILHVLGRALASGKQYDRCIVTRYDCQFQGSFDLGTMPEDQLWIGANRNHAYLHGVSASDILFAFQFTRATEFPKILSNLQRWHTNSRAYKYPEDVANDFFFSTFQVKHVWHWNREFTICR